MSLTLAEQTGAQAISTDKVRRQLQQEGAISGGIGDLDAGLYAPENVTKVYDEVLRRARLLLSAGVSVILDGTWRDAYQRQRARTMAEQTRTPLVEFTCSVSLAEAAARIVERPASSSDATPQIAAALAGRDTERAEGHPIDTSRPLAESVAEAQQICRLAT